MLCGLLLPVSVLDESHTTAAVSAPASRKTTAAAVGRTCQSGQEVIGGLVIAGGAGEGVRLEWIGELFARENVDRTVAALVGSQGEGGSGARETIRARLTEAEAKLRRLQAAIEAGVEPTALVESINEAQAQRAALRAELDNVPRRACAGTPRSRP